MAVRDAVPIKVKIGLRSNGHADHPDWTILPLASAGSTRVDKEALVKAQQITSWHYDKTSGHDEETADSPKGQQWGMMLVTLQYATEAVATFPGIVTIMTEAEARTFWEVKAYAHISNEDRNRDELAALATQRQLMIDLNRPATERNALDATIAKALDPDDPTPGVRRPSTPKTWAEAKTKRGFTIP